MDFIKDWYVQAFPHDSVGEDILPSATFEGLYSCLPDVYVYLGVYDSLVRERVFEQLALIKGLDYVDIYYGWLTGEAMPPTKIKVCSREN